MKTQFLSLLTFVLTASACSVPSEEVASSHEAAAAVELQPKAFFTTPSKMEKNPVQNAYVIVDISTDTPDIPNAIEVDYIPEIDAVVYEVEEGAYIEHDVPYQEDAVVVVDNADDQLVDSDLWVALSSTVNRTVGFIGSAPADIQLHCTKTGNHAVVYEEGEEEVYESEVIRRVIEFSKGDVDYFYVPVLQEDVSDMLEQAIVFAQEEGVEVFARNGERF